MPNISDLVSKLFFRLLIVAAAAALAVGISWVMASVAVSDVLGEPPPDMGLKSVAFNWKGAPELPSHPRAWLFDYRGTRIPGAPTVRIFVSPFGKLLRVEPGGLAAHLKAMHRDF